MPEKSVGNNIVNFVETIIREKLDVSEEINIERAYQAASFTETRSTIVHFQNYNMWQRVLEAAWAKKDIQVKGHRIYFDEHFTTQVFAERAKYRKVRKHL